MRALLLVALPISSLFGQTCTYDSCALLREGPWIVRGISRERVARFGVLAPAKVGPLMSQSSDSARALGRVFEQKYRSGSTKIVLGTSISAVALTVGSLSYIGGARRTSSDALLWGAGVAGFGIGLLGQNDQRDAIIALNRAIWWHNRDLPRP